MAAPKRVPGYDMVAAVVVGGGPGVGETERLSWSREPQGLRGRGGDEGKGCRLCGVMLSEERLEEMSWVLREGGERRRFSPASGDELRVGTDAENRTPLS